MLKFSNFGILWKVLTLVGLLSAFVVVGALYSTSRMRLIDSSYGDLLDGYGRGNLAISRANRNLVYIDRSLFKLLAETNVDRRKEASQEAVDSVGFFQKQIKLATQALPDHTKEISDIDRRVSEAMAGACAEVLRLGVSQAPGDAAAAREEMRAACDPAFDSLMRDASALNNKLTKERDAASDRTLALTDRTISDTYIYLLGALALMAGLAAAMARYSISRPIRAIADVLEKLSLGARDLEVPGAGRRDEVGMIARAAVRFREQSDEGLRIRQHAADLASAEAGRATREQQEKARAAVALGNVLERLGEALRSLAEGDLTTRLGDDFDASYARLRDDFNVAIRKLGDTIGSVVSGAKNIDAGAREMLAAAEQLATRAETQATIVENSSASVRQLSGVINKTAAASTRTKDIITAAKEEATVSIETVRETEQAIERIKTSSERIGSIIGVIDEIAFQTNLLALNAGVEAARAGDAGRGFAVVASEVRALAQRSAAAAKEIKGLVSASEGEVANGVDLVKATGVAFDKIRTQIGVIDGGIADIAGQAVDQSQSLKQVNLALTEIDQGTQMNAAMAEQATAACRSLTHEVDALNEQIGTFRLVAEEADAPSLIADLAAAA
jgi:methyl-accepting chemotaxis protein